MTYVISSPCIDKLDRSCVKVCPVDCIYEGLRKLYIQPDECIDCGACQPACPVQAIAYSEDVLEHDLAFIRDSARFFSEPLPGKAEPLGMPGGARDLPALGVDTPLVAAFTPGAADLVKG